MRRAARRDRRQRLVAVARGTRFIPLVLENTGYQLPDIHLVIDDENVGRHID